MNLIANGYKNNNEIIDEFTGHITDFFSDFTTIIRAWNLLEKFEYPERTKK